MTFLKKSDFSIQGGTLVFSENSQKILPKNQGGVLRGKGADLVMKTKSTEHKRCVKKEKHENFHRKKKTCDFPAVIALYTCIDCN